MMWWEPWELSAGQIYKCLSQLPKDGFGLMIHSNIAEVQMARPVDVWFRNTARMCMQLGITVVGEAFFCSRTEEIEPLSIPCLRLVDEELAAITSVPGIVGIKEYYGVLPLEPDFNLDMLRARLTDSASSTDELLVRITQKYGEYGEDVRRLLGYLADAFQVFPWDVSWFARSAGTADIYHGWKGGIIRGQMVETPSWRSTRCCHFMKTDDARPHPFMLEDVQLRCEVAEEILAQAINTCRTLTDTLPEGEESDMFGRLQQHIDKFRRVVVSYALHLRETNVTVLLRENIQSGRPMTPRLVEELGRLLDADVENQGGRGRVVSMKTLFAERPEEFVLSQLIPTEETVVEKGCHTLTTR